MARERQEIERIKLMKEKQYMSPYEEMRAKYLKSTMSQDGRKKEGKLGGDYDYESENESLGHRDQ